MKIVLRFCRVKVRLPSITDQRPWQEEVNCPCDMAILLLMSSYRKHWYRSFCSAHWLSRELTRATKYLLFPSFHFATQVILSTDKMLTSNLIVQVKPHLYSLTPEYQDRPGILSEKFQVSNITKVGGWPGGRCRHCGRCPSERAGACTAWWRLPSRMPWSAAPGTWSRSLPLYTSTLTWRGHWTGLLHTLIMEYMAASPGISRHSVIMPPGRVTSRDWLSQSPEVISDITLVKVTLLEHPTQ